MPRARLYVSRSAYVAGLLVLVCTAWLLLAGTQIIRNVGDMARFGAMLFQILAPLQLALAVFFSALAAASGVAQEKDRRTLLLLLLTNLSNSELVLGKLMASLLNVLVLLAASLPLFMLTAPVGRCFVPADRPSVCRHSCRGRGGGQPGLDPRCGVKRRFRP